MQPVPCPRCSSLIPVDSPHGICPRCFLDSHFGRTGVVFTAMGDSPPPPPPEPAEVQPLFPHLEIVRLIGRGGMGAVYEARQRGLGRRVALKLLWAPSVPDAAFEERFSREGQTLARLAHDHIVTVFDAGKSGPHYWLLMEFVEGQSLRALLGLGRLEPKQALDYAMQMSAGLAYAHGQGVVHRDIKPENVLVTPDGRIKLVDFGLAKILETVPHRSALTKTEQVMGTPHYMAPEQLERPREVDHRADVYSLGVVLYECLTGELPLGRFPPASRDTGVDARIDDVIGRLLQKEPARRYQAAADVHAAIGLVASAAGRATRTPARPRPRPKSTPYASYAIALAALAGAGWVANRVIDAANPVEERLGAAEHFARGRALLDRGDHAQALVHFRAAYASEPRLEGLEAALVDALRRASATASPEDSLRMAAELRRVQPSAAADERYAFAAARVGDDWRSRITTSPAHGGNVETAPQFLTGTLATTAGVTGLSVDGVAVEYVSSRFRWPLPAKLDEGEYTVPLRLEFGDEAGAPVPITFTVDALPPQIKVRSHAQGAIVASPVTLRGEVEDATDVVLTCDGRAVPVDANEQWSIDLTLEPGPHSVELVATDALQRPAKYVQELIVDVAAPTIRSRSFGLDRDADELVTVSVKRGEPFLRDRFRVLDDHRVARVTWDGAAVSVDGDGIVDRLALAASRPSSPDHELVVEDAAGHRSRCVVRTTEDGAAPKFELDAEEDKVVVGQTYWLQGTLEDASECELSINGVRRASVSSGQVKFPLTIEPTTKRLSIEVCDEAGNRSPSRLKTLVHVAACEAEGCVILEDGSPGRCEACLGSGKAVDSSCQACHGDGESTSDCKACRDGKELCAPCFGTGMVQAKSCTTCGGSRKVPCTGCDEKGRNTVTCLDCGGSGRLPPGRLKSRGGSCVQCGGKGTYRKLHIDCGGTHETTCPACRSHTDCGLCERGFTGRLCGECEGQKRIRVPCAVCNATGDRPGRPCRSCDRGYCRSCLGTGQKGVPPDELERLRRAIPSR